MLVLTRKLNQSIRVGPDIVVHVVSLSEHRVQIGIEAPREVHIVRTELTEEKADAGGK